MFMLSIIAPLASALMTVQIDPNDLYNLAPSNSGSLSRSGRNVNGKAACGVPCQRFPYPIRRSQLIKVIARAAGAEDRKIVLKEPAQLIGRMYVDIGSCMGNCVQGTNMIQTRFSENSCQVSQKQSMLISIDGQDVIVPDILVKTCKCALSFSCHNALDDLRA